MGTSINVNLSQTSYKAGDVVQGKVTLIVDDKKSTGTSAEKLSVVIKGEEKTEVHWSETRTVGSGDNKRTETVHHTERDSKDLFSYEFILATFSKGKVYSGKYEYPFEAKLPISLPSSMKCSSGSSKCAIRYLASAKLKRPGMFKFDKKVELEFDAKSPPDRVPEKQEPYMCPPDAQKINFCCLFNRGTISLGSVLHKTILTQGDDFVLGFACDNNSTVEVRNIKIKVREYVYWSANGHSETKTITLCKEHLDPSVLSSRRYSGVNETTESVAKTLYQQLTSEIPGKNEIKLWISKDARDSYYGSILNVKHSVEVTLTTPTCVNDPYVSSDIQIISSAPSMVIDEAIQPSDLDGTQTETTVNSEFAPDNNSSFDTFENIANVGGTVVQKQDGSNIPDVMENVPTSSPPASYEKLIQEIDSSFNVLYLIEDYSKNDSLGYKSILQNISPRQFGAIVSKVTFSNDLKQVSEQIGELLGSKFTCDYIVYGCRMVSDMNRADLVKATAPLAVDLNENREKIAECLDSFEKLVCKDALEGRKML